MIKRILNDENGGVTILNTMYFILFILLFWILLLNFCNRGSGLNATHLMADAASRSGTVANAVEKQYSVREHMTGNLEYDFHVYTMLNRNESLKNVKTVLESWEQKHPMLSDITFGDSTSNVTIPIWSYRKHAYEEVLPPANSNINYKYDNGVCGIWVSANGALINPEILMLPKDQKFNILVQSQSTARGSVTGIH